MSLFLKDSVGRALLGCTGCLGKWCIVVQKHVLIVGRKLQWTMTTVTGATGENYKNVRVARLKCWTT